MSKGYWEDLKGQKIGKLKVVKFVPTDDDDVYWLCKYVFEEGKIEYIPETADDADELEEFSKRLEYVHKRIENRKYYIDNGHAVDKEIELAVEWLAWHLGPETFDVDIKRYDEAYDLVVARHNELVAGGAPWMY